MRERFDLHWRTILAVPAALLALFAAFAFVRATRQSLTWVVIGTVVAVALDPVVDSVQRRLHIRRGTAVSVVSVLVAGSAALVVFFLGPPAVREAQNFSNDLPGVVNRLGEIPIIGDRLKKANAPERLQNFLEDLPQRLSNNDQPLVRIVDSVIGGALAAFSTVIVTIALLLDGHRLVRVTRRLVPHEHRPQTDRAFDIVSRTIGHYFAGSIFVAMLSGIVMLGVGLALGVPLAPLAAIWAAVTNLIPQIGGFLGGSFFVLLGFSKSPTTGVLCLLYFLVYQQFENHVIQPTIIGQAVDLSPPVTMMAALVGGAAAGVPGALVGVPLVGVVKALWFELRGVGPTERPARHEGWLRRRLRRGDTEPTSS